MSMGNANVGDWSQSCSKLVLSLDKGTSVPWHMFCTALENGSGITTNIFKIISYYFMLQNLHGNSECALGL